MSVSAADSVAVAQELPFCLGAAVISIAHAGEARDAVEDLNEAIVMLERHKAMLLADRAALRADLEAQVIQTSASVTSQFPGSLYSGDPYPGLTEANVGWDPVVHNPDGSSHMIVVLTE